MKPFQFKEFTVHQDKTAMKIGTDAVLLGAWSSIEKYPDTILDVGAGTGVIALMLAQRCDAMTIDAVEVDESAYEQTVENFEQSDWGDRLFCYHTSFEEFADEMAEEEEVYDLIISNPPFYTDEFESDDEARNKARFTSSLSFEELLKGVSKILSEEGVFSTIIPFKEEENFVRLAETFNLNLNSVCRVKGNPTSEVKRSLLAFSFKVSEVIEEELTIETKRHQYTDAYINLTKDFYLKM
ncbi:tRNA1Val (adenine37-N6)-methyltransferase [Tenacibaculum adriaticum]|uniref:tRNA1(Val) (adenine(37)-N6)-methyltransferase n=1 Tax=Tenacibaculum adriaticum TaxID=413713 RepID=A0A5S5DXC9_9FLAO|nr:methyltransferase [Tenacibaculum adriaticum]TYP99452.1 tRNA1Val (adenine37-N6)-methyltransferase [Tenacibaculum adriaticum]